MAGRRHFLAGAAAISVVPFAAARATLDRRLVVAFQPHRYSRTRQLMQEFGPSLREADEIVLADIYAAGEEPMPGVTLDTLGAAIREGPGRQIGRAHV